MRLRVCLLVVAALGCVPTTASAAGLKAGAARADITPPVGTPMFAYTARSAVAGAQLDRPMQIVADPDQNSYAKSFVPSKGIHTRLQARSIVLKQDGAKYALVQVDLGGVPYALTQEVAKRVAWTGITADRILLSATHTHSATGPIWPADNGGYQALGGDFFDPRVFDLTAAGIADSIMAANAKLQDAQVGVGTTAVRDASRNRNFVPFRRNADVPADEAGARAVSIDPTLTVLRVDDAAGRPMAVWSNFAIHETSFGDDNLLFSGDNAAFTERIVEAEIRQSTGAPHDFVNVWTNGSEGDISPNGGPSTVGGEQAEHVNSSFGSAHLAGRRVADGILRAWREAASTMTSAPRLGARRSFVAFDGTSYDGRPVGPIAALGQGGIVAEDGTCSEVEDAAGPGQGKKLPALIGAGLVPSIVPISVWNVEGLGIAALPSEITKQMGERIRTAIDAEGFDRVALAGLTNAYISYTSTPEEYDACHYEGSFTLFGRHMGLRWIDEALKLTGPLLDGSAAPSGAPEPPNLAFGLMGNVTPPRQTPAAGSAVEQPADTTRTRTATYRWNGGDPAIDFHRSRAFVKLQRQVDGVWRNVLTDDSFQDTVERTGRDVWTETVQFTECDAPGRYRFMVDGRADRGSGVQQYLAFSRPFNVAAVRLEAGAVSVTDGTARVRVRYPAPPANSLLALPRLVRTGTATLRVTAADGTVSTVTATPADDGSFAAAVPAGSTAELVAAEDRCGNRN